MSEFQVKDFTVKTANRALFTSDMQTLYTATIVVPDHGFLGVSRWHDEPYWVVDSRFGENGFPHFSNGEGTRLTSVQPLADDHPVTHELNALMPKEES